MKKRSILTLVVILISLSIPGKTSASHLLSPTSTPQSTVNNILSRFMYYREIPKLNGSITQVVEVILPQVTTAGYSSYALVEDETTTLQPYQIVTKALKPTYKVYNVSKNNEALSEVYLSDNNMNTYYDFPLSSIGSRDKVVLRFVYNQAITSQSLQLFFSSNGETPTSVTLKAINNDKENIIFAERPYSNGVFFFPKQTALIWEVTLNHSQPLRMLEANFLEEQQSIANIQSIRFLMRPGSPYILFSHPEGYVNTPYLESGDLNSVSDVLSLSLPSELPNPLYRPADDDADGIANSTDNCPSVANPDQKDKNKNRVGDACEDFDKDGIMNSLDNCPDRKSVV